MSIWKKIRNYLADLYNWRTERGLVKEENQRMWEMLQYSETCKDTLLVEQARQERAWEERVDALTTENEQLTKIIDELSEELLHQRDINECLWRDWAVKNGEWDAATRKLQTKDDTEYRLWAEHHILLATLLVTEPEEAAKFHV